MLFIALIHIGCNDVGCNVISNTTFNTTLSQAEHPKIFVSNGWEYVQGGICGLIVYNNGDGLLAYDRCSTVGKSSRNTLSVDGFQILDAVSGAKWLLLDGSPSYLAECPLQRYNVRKQGNFYVVTN